MIDFTHMNMLKSFIPQFVFLRILRLEPGCICRLVSVVLLNVFFWNAGDAAPPPEASSPQLRLYYFACDNDVEGLKSALAEGADVEGISESGFTALQYAIYLNRREAFDFLLENGADPGGYGDAGIDMNALALAAVMERTEMAYELLERDADIMGPGNPRHHQMSALAYAALYGRVELVERMIEKGSDPHLRHQRFQHPRHEARFPLMAFAVRHGGVEIVRLLVEKYGLSVNNDFDIQESNPLWTAVKYGNLDVAEFLIRNGADVNAVNLDRGKRLSCLGVAARYGRYEETRLLLANGAKIPEGTPYSQLPYVIADANGYENIYQLYEKNGYESGLWDDLQRRRKRDTEQVRNQVLSSDLAAEILPGKWSGRGKFDVAEAKGSVRVAVVSVQEGAAPLSDLLTAMLSAYPAVQLVERNDLDAVLEEQQLQRSGLTEHDTMSRLSNLLGAEVLMLVEKIELEGDALYQVRTVDAVQGIQLSSAYSRLGEDGMAEFASMYAASMQTKLMETGQPLNNRIPVVLVNVRADIGNSRGVILEELFRRGLAQGLMEAEGVILLQRDGLERLLREKYLGGTESEAFTASAVYVDARVNLGDDERSAASLVLRLEKGEGVVSTIRLEAGESSQAELVERTVRKVLNELSVTDYTDLGTSIERDAEKLFQEARWLRQVGETEEGIRKLKDAIALGFEEERAWELYLQLVEDELKRVPDNEGADDVYRRRLELMRERLIVFDGLWRSVQPDTMEDKPFAVPVAIEYIRWVLARFSMDLEHFRYVTVRRRYADDIRELEASYLRFLKTWVTPLYVDPSPELIKRVLKAGPADLLLHVLTPMSQFTYHERSEVEELLRPMVRGLAEIPEYQGDNARYIHIPSRVFHSAPCGAEWDRMLIGLFDEMDGTCIPDVYNWTLMEAHHSWAKYMGTRPSGIRDFQRYYTRMKQNFQSGSPELRARMVRNQFSALPHQLGFPRGENGLFLTKIAISLRAKLTYRTAEMERELLKSYILKKGEKRMQPHDFNRLEELRSAEVLYRKRLEILGEPLSRFPEKVNGFRDRVDYFTAYEKGQNVPRTESHAKLPVKIWHPRLYGLPEFSDKDRFLHDPVLMDGYWWILAARDDSGKVKWIWGTRQARNLILFRIDADTLETTAREFESRVLNGSNYDVIAGKDYLALYSRVSKGVYDLPQFYLLNLRTLEVRNEPNYQPVSQSMDPMAIALENTLYLHVSPWELYGERWFSGKPPSQLMFMKYDMSGKRDTEVIFNTRRNPSETLLDTPPGKNYSFSYNWGSELFILGNHSRAAFDPETGELRAVSNQEKERLHFLDRQGKEMNRFVKDNEGGRWVEMRRMRSELYPVEHYMQEFMYARPARKQLGEQSGVRFRKALQFIPEKPSGPFEPYDRYQYALDNDLFNAGNWINGNVMFGETHGIARMSYLKDDNSKRAGSFWVFFRNNELLEALEFAEKLP